MTEVVIAKRFAGPPESGNGGYTCGVTAGALDHDGFVTATLRVPSPLETPLVLETSAGTATLRHGDVVVADAVADVADPDVPAPVSFGQASDAASAFDRAAYERGHWFPGCFACGPARGDGDGLRLFPAAVEGRDDLVAWPWVPHESVGDADGFVHDAVVWAALDCPSGLAASPGVPTRDAAVLGRMTARVGRPVRVGERLVARGWAIGEAGRKRSSGSVLWDSDGAVVAVNLATWIVLTPEQQERFRPGASS